MVRRKFGRQVPLSFFCEYNAWAIVYAWTGSKVDKIWLRELAANSMYGPNTNTYESVDSATTPCFTVAYDANGNTLSDPSGKSYTWDFENRLTQAGGARHRNDDLQVRSLRQENPEVRPARNHELPL